MRYLYLLVALVLSSTAFAEQRPDSNQYKCMTEQETSLYYDKLLGGYLKGDWFGGLTLTGELEKCIEEGSFYASYELGIWEYFMSLESLEKSKNFLKNKEFDASIYFDKQAGVDSVKAVKHLEQSAKVGYPYAYFKLGEIYRDGLTVPKSKIFAGDYFTLAGFAAFKVGLNLLGTKSYENARELTPDHPEIEDLKKLVFKNR